MSGLVGDGKLYSSVSEMLTDMGHGGLVAGYERLSRGRETRRLRGLVDRPARLYPRRSKARGTAWRYRYINMYREKGSR